MAEISYSDEFSDVSSSDFDDFYSSGEVDTGSDQEDHYPYHPGYMYEPISENLEDEISDNSDESSESNVRVGHTEW